jgi:hypothetical protein
MFSILHQSLCNLWIRLRFITERADLRLCTRPERKALAFEEVSLMSPNLRLSSFSVSDKTKIKHNLVRFALRFVSMLVTINCVAQQLNPAQPDANSADSYNQAAVAAANPGRTASTITVPAGARIALVLMHPIQSRYVHRGDDIYAQTTSPVLAGNEVVIPPGTFVQGKVDKLTRAGNRAELSLQSVAITFQDGYVATLTGPATLESGDGYAIKDPGKGRIVGGFALPMAGVGIGALIGHSLASSQGTTITSTLPPGCTGPPPYCLSSSLTGPPETGRDTAIGAAVGGAIGAVASLALLFNTHNFFIDVGSPIEMVLQHPLSLDQDQVADAIRDAGKHPAAQQPLAPRPQILNPQINGDSGICYTPGSPGTPDIDIPGTPAVGDSPGTPETHIPGIPATPPVAHPCP